MPEQVIQVDDRLNEVAALQLAADLNLLDAQGNVTLDFSRTTHFEPIAMLLVSSAVNRLRKRIEQAGFVVSISPSGIDPEGIAAHMGFWRSMGLAIGRDINAEAHRETYLPITRIGIDDLYRESAGGDPRASGIVERRARELATVLAQPKSAELLESLSYSLRELIRNVIEHAMTPALWVAGMSWPKRNYVQVAVLDEGQGVRKSLATSVQFRYSSDIEALRAAVQPGISRNLGRELTREQVEKWEDQRSEFPAEMFMNAGYGLYMISSFCREAGQFLLASGNASLAYVGSAEVEGATGHHGTALRLVLQPSEVPAAWERLFSGNLARGPAGRKPMLSASTLRRLELDSLTGDQSAPEHK